MRQKSIVSGASRITARYPSAVKRTAYLRSTFVPRGEPAQAADREQDEERQREQDDRDRSRSRRVAVLALVEHVDRGDLGPERDVPREDHDGADLADRAGERHRYAREDPRKDARQHDPR